MTEETRTEAHRPACRKSAGCGAKAQQYRFNAATDNLHDLASCHGCRGFAPTELLFVAIAIGGGVPLLRH